MSDEGRRPSRRSFLTGRALIDVVRTAAARALEDGILGHLVPEVSCVHAARYAMGTVFTVSLPAGVSDAGRLAMAALDLVQEIEDKLTVYHDRSLIARVNRAAAEQPVPVDEELMELLVRCKELWEETAGAFDVAAGALVDAWGFVHGPRRVPNQEELEAALRASGSRYLELDQERRMVRFARNGLKLNFGSIGKGYALDRAAALIRAEADVPAGVIQGGKSSIYAWGRPHRNARGWPVAVGDPTGRQNRLVTVWLQNEGLATASNVIQFVDGDGRRYGHVLDPRTGWPAESVLQATAICPSAADADALATAFFVLGLEGTQSYCQRHPDVGAFLVTADDSGGARLHVVGEPARESLD